MAIVLGEQRILATESIPKKTEHRSKQERLLKNEKRISSLYAPTGRPLHWITLKDILWVLYLYPVRLLSRIPNLVHPLLHIAGPVFQILSATWKTEVVQRVADAFGPEKPTSTLEAIVRKFVANAVQQSGDDLMLERDNVKVRCISFQGREHLDSALAAEKGVLLVGLHWFAERPAKRYLAELGYPVMSVRNPTPPVHHMGRIGQRFLQPRYSRFLHDVIRDEVFVQDPECSLKILGRLRSGGIVNILLDASFSQQKVKLPFLGRIREFPMGVLYLAKISGCAVLPMLVLGHAQAIEIHMEHPLTLDLRLPIEEFCRVHMPTLIHIMESHVRQYPDQWISWTSDLVQ